MRSFWDNCWLSESETITETINTSSIEHTASHADHPGYVKLRRASISSIICSGSRTGDRATGAMRSSGMKRHACLDKWTLHLLNIVLLLCAHTAFGKSCFKDKDITHLAVLPGHGWDNLRNMEMLNVLQISFSECRKSLDELYYIPNHAEIIPRMTTNMETFSEVFEHYQNYRSMRSTSVNVGASGSYFGISISGSFSNEHQSVRTSQINGRSITTRVQLRQHLFTVLVGQRTPLTQGFRDRVLDIGFQLHFNKTTEAAHLADMLIADYGTHVITRVDAGGVIWKLDSLKTNSRELSNSQRTSISASASVGFKSIFKVSTGVNHTSSDSSVAQYHHNLTSQKVGSHGGKPFKPGMEVSEWADSIPKNLVAIDMDGDPIYNVISPLYLGESISYKLVGQINGAVREAFKRYYQANTVIGCMNPGSKNFEPRANIPSKDCNMKTSNFTLGGFFQRCQGNKEICKLGNLTIVNIMTQDLSCPAGYQEVELLSRMLISMEWCDDDFWKKVFGGDCRWIYVRYTITWCAAETQNSSSENGFLFGGIYTKSSVNLITGAHSCPPHFLSVKYGAGDIRMCLSRDFELSGGYQVNFGGFFSCKAGNPYTVLQSGKPKGGSTPPIQTVSSFLNDAGHDSWPHRCPDGFAQHMGFIDAGCEMMYCMKARQMKQVQEQKVIRPPFVLLPEGSALKPRADYDLKQRAGTWTYNNQKATWNFSERSNMHTVVGVLVTVACTMCLAAIIAGVIFVRRRRKAAEQKRYQCKPENHTLEAQLDNLYSTRSYISEYDDKQ